MIAAHQQECFDRCVTDLAEHFEGFILVALGQTGWTPEDKKLGEVKVAFDDPANLLCKVVPQLIRKMEGAAV